MDGFIEEVQRQFKEQARTDFSERVQQLTQWGLKPTDSLQDLEVMAQRCLNTHYVGIKISTSAFYDMVSANFLGDSNSIIRKAKSDPQFGALYVYMCLYYDNIIINENSNISNNELSFDSSYYGKTLQEFINEDFNLNFKDTQIPIILREYSKKEEIQSSSPWPALNGSSVQWYARRYSSNETGNTSEYFYLPDRDCTNFVSQALFYGGLYMTFTNSDKTADGYVETQKRWFYFKNNTSTGHSVSTSWVRVNELYNYLSPHYATLETKSNSTMTPYLNKGFVLQGKAFIGGYSHSVIITITNGKYTYCAHSRSRCNEPIETFYNSYYKCRVIQTY